MSLSYFNVKKFRRHSKQHDAQGSAAAPAEPTVASSSQEAAPSPVLDPEDEKFLERLAAIAQEPEGTPPPLPDRPVVILDGGEKKVGKDAEDVLFEEANKIPLPMSPPEVTVEDNEKGKGKESDLGRRKTMMSYFNRFKKTADNTKEKGKEKITNKDREVAANDLHSAAEAAKSAEQKEAEKEQQDLTQILDQLNLSAVNNRVFSFSKESEELLNNFKLVLMDLVNGVPTAYNDLEKLLTGSEDQLKKMYGTLPPFLQSLVKTLPAKITTALGPELLAAQAEKPGFDAKQRAGTSSGWKSKTAKTAIPSLKSLVSAQGAVATMLKSILNFLKLRFPALIGGTNILLSLAVCLLLFVFWYCHKRGRETRLDKERLADSSLASSASSFTDNDGDSARINIEGESSRANEEPAPPLIISDNKEPGPEQPSAATQDLPSVSHLPEPGDGAPAKEPPLQVPQSK
ncbi:hypothetical protein BDV95DRAFT_585256 [Massariosphaeria phaeospora]|uniref:Uncharacterized protein n=1 Tax=Massariosphaeria phaeospora TaxID=100035 RepID=A0A7C8M1E7_9PLEO|nr:hypothetical protein BDV95DRAFT_585256 [Massariosphaeria phaeospora]